MSNPEVSINLKLELYLSWIKFCIKVQYVVINSWLWSISIPSNSHDLFLEKYEASSRRKLEIVHLQFLHFIPVAQKIKSVTFQYKKSHRSLPVNLFCQTIGWKYLVQLFIFPCTDTCELWFARYVNKYLFYSYCFFHVFSQKLNEDIHIHVLCLTVWLSATKYWLEPNK